MIVVDIYFLSNFGRTYCYVEMAKEQSTICHATSDPVLDWLCDSYGVCRGISYTYSFHNSIPSSHWYIDFSICSLVGPIKHSWPYQTIAIQ